jgi:serine/threonine-protein kinase
MATVYGALHPLIGKKAAIKVMNPALSMDAGLVERFVLEAQAVNKIGHPNIVDVFSFGKLSDGRSYFVMEWLPGETLYARMWSRRLTLDEALDVLDQICDALEAAHEAGIVHRDLKPANVFLVPRRSKREQVKLLDFGVAKLMRQADEPLALVGPQTQVGQVVGTPEYVSPEQARGKPVDGKCDVYALGVIAYEMILGERPFNADNSADLVRMHLSEKPPQPRSVWPEIPTPLNDLMLSMLEKKAPDRPSPHEVRAILRELRGTPPPLDFSDGTDGSFTPAPAKLMPTPKPALMLPHARSWRVVAAVLAIAGAAGVGLLTWHLRHPARASRVTESATPSLSANRTGAAAAATGPSPGTTALSPRATAASSRATADEITPPKPIETTMPGVADDAAAGTVLVRVDASDARIDLDGELVAQAASGARVRTSAGAHTLGVTATGRKPYSNKFVIAAGATIDLNVHLSHRGPARPTSTEGATPQRQDPDYLVDPFGGHK